MTATPLARCPLLATSDVEQAREVIGAWFCAHRLVPTSVGAVLDVVCNGAPIGAAVTLSYLRYGAEVRITAGRLGDFYLAQIPLGGSARVRVGEAVIASDRRFGTLGSPTEAVDMIWSSDCEQLLVSMRAAAVEEVAAEVDPGAARPLVFRPLLDLGAPAIRSWLSLVRLAVEDLETGGQMFRTGFAAACFERALIASLLSAQPSSAYPRPPAGVAAGSRAVRHAMQAIDAEPDRAWRVADLAVCAGVSVRALQEAFHRELGVSPLVALRRVRLERVRRDLLAADAGPGTVTEVAARWGFFHLGRFARAYREVYQELPSATLAR